MQKIGKVLNTDVGKLARQAKMGLARRKVRKIRMDRMADDAGGALRKKAGFGKYVEKNINKNAKTRKDVRKNRKTYWKGREAYNKRAGVTKGMERAAQRTTDRTIARRLRKDKIAKRKAKERAKNIQIGKELRHKFKSKDGTNRQVRIRQRNLDKRWEAQKARRAARQAQRDRES